MRTTDEVDPAKQVRQILATRIREYREYREVSRRELAELIVELGVPVTADSVRQWENAVAAPRWLMSVAIAQALDVRWGLIFDLDAVTLPTSKEQQ